MYLGGGGLGGGGGGLGGGGLGGGGLLSKTHTKSPILRTGTEVNTSFEKLMLKIKFRTTHLLMFSVHMPQT